MDLKQLISTAKAEGASEIHLKSGSPPIMRQRKFLKRMSLPALQTADIEGIVNGLSPDDQKKFKDKGFFEGTYFGSDPCNYCLNLFKSQGLTCGLVRIQASTVPSFESCRLPPVLETMLDSHSGLLILSGPPRSGISSTLAAMIEKINQSRPAHVLALADHIEYFFEPKKARITQRQMGKDLTSFEGGLNFAKRMDVDVLVIGDMRKEIPLKNILEYVSGGHFAILTMQTLGVMVTLDKFMNSFPESDRDYVANFLSHDLVGVISQTLLVNPMQMIPAHEVLEVNINIRKLLQQGKVAQLEHNFKSAGKGSILFDQDVPLLIKEQKINRDTGDAFLTWYKSLRT